MRVKTIETAIESGMSQQTDLNHATTCCPECGCDWYGNKNACGEGHRTCYLCYQDWWLHIDYKDKHKLVKLT